MVRLLLFCYAFLATTSVFGAPLEDGQYRISIANLGAPRYLGTPRYLKLLRPDANATFELETIPGADVWTVDTTGLGLRTLTSNEHQVRLSYANTNPGTPLQGMETGSMNLDTFNVEEGPDGGYYVHPSSSSDETVGYEETPTPDQGRTAVFLSITFNPPIAITFTPVD